MSEAFHCFDSANSPWRTSTMAEGSEFKDLGTVNGRSMQLVRCLPGTGFPRHVHEGPGHAYLLEVGADQAGQNLTAGWVSAAQTGTVAEAFPTRG